MASLSEISIRRPVFAWMLMAALIIFGGISFKRLGVSQMPDVDFPVVNIALTWNGAAPEVMEVQVVDPIEDAIMGIDGIRSVTSQSRQGSANITIEFDIDRNIDVAIEQVETKTSQVAKLLPTNLDPPVIKKTNPEDQPIFWLTLTSDGTVPLFEQMLYARNVLYDKFSVVDGVGDIALGGYTDPNLRVWVSTEKLKKFQVTAADVNNAISTEDIELPAGRIENDEHEFNVRLLGEAKNPTDFGKIFINEHGSLPNYRPIQLKDVARSEESLADVRKIARFNGNPTVGLGILKQHGSNAVAVADGIRKRLAEVQADLPPYYKLDVRVDNVQFIKDSVNELNLTLVLSAILTSVVCYLFLGSWSSTFNVLLAIPTSIVGAFMVLYFYGFTLNTFTLLGLSLAIGIVVDDAIMMLENIVRHAEMGKKKRRASLEGSQEITFAALAATLAIVAIFLPVVFMKGIIGKFFYQYGITVTAAVLLSLLEALTLTPMRCSRFLHIHSPGTGGFVARGGDYVMGRLSAGYSAILRTLLNHRILTVCAALAMFAFSIKIAKMLPSELTPSQDQSRLLVRVRGPVGSAITFTDEKFKKAEAYLKTIKEVEGAYVVVGGFGGDAVNEGQIYVSLVDMDKRKLSQTAMMGILRAGIKKAMPGMQVFVQDLSLRGFTATRGYPIEFSIQGPDWDTLGRLGDTMMEEMRKSGTLVDINTDYQVGMPEVQITPDRARAAFRSVKLSDIATTVNTLIGGNIFTGNVRYPKGGHRYDINVRLDAPDRDKVDNLKDLYVRNTYNELVPLIELVHVNQKPTPQIISRYNRERAVPIYANVAKGHAQAEALATIEKLGPKILPSGYHIVLTGNAQTFRESFQSLIVAMLLGIIVSYMVLASQFNSFIHPVTVLMALPFSLSGAFIALMLSHQSLNMFSVIGLILLLGIVKKNSILLVDFTNQVRAEGKNVREALLIACPVRLRPILMTSIATIAGAVPEAISFGPGSETRVPMAMAIIGGVLVSTILTLFVVPCVYSLFSRFERATAPAADPEPAGPHASPRPNHPELSHA